MNQIWNPDNRFFSGVRKAMDLICLNILWVICSLPVMTVGAATCGLYYAVVKNIRQGRSYPVREFFRGMKENFWRATGVWMTVLVFFMMGGVGDFMLFGAFFKMESAADILFSCLFILKLLLPVFVFLYAFPMMSHFELPSIQVLEKSLMISGLHAGRTLLLTLLLATAAVFAAAETLLLLFLPGTYCLVASFLLEPVWKTYAPCSDRT